MGRKKVKHMVGVSGWRKAQRRRKRSEREVKEEAVPMNERRMSRLLGKLLAILEKEDSSGNFRMLPMEGAAWAESYRKVISPLVDFSIIRQRINQFGYTQENMLKDLEQLYENTAKFNGPNHELAEMAKRFVVIAKKFNEDNKDVRAVGSCDV